MYIFHFKTLIYVNIENIYLQYLFLQNNISMISHFVFIIISYMLIITLSSFILMLYFIMNLGLYYMCT